MTKIVYSACYGGFGLSHEAILRYAEIKGIKLWVEDREHSSLIGPTYWTVPPEERPKEIPNWNQAPLEERKAYNEALTKSQLYYRDIDRTDPALVQVVEELGSKANTRFSDLKIAEIPSGTLYRIDEYDGFESVMTQSEYDWKVA